jgi:histone acetyltransferase HTATIP
MDLDESDDMEIKTEDPGTQTDASAIREGEEMDLDANHSENPVYVSREQEIEKLRTSGSMTQDTHEIARVKNFSLIQIGKFEVEPWYFSPYPVELTDYDKLYICEFCFCYFGPKKSFERHRSKCNLFHPPGNEIYRHEDVSFFEIDGRRQRTWCRNLCLLSKLFLDHKTLYYDVDPFMFYCMCVRDDYGAHLYGYFSKEKESAEGYNVACILTLPQYQRLGYGKLLIAFSYELSRKEGKLGSPEKPLSDLGLLSYRAYWTETLVNILVNHTEDINLDELAAMTSMTTNDVMNTLKHLGMLKFAVHLIPSLQANCDLARQALHRSNRPCRGTVQQIKNKKKANNKSR